MELVVIKAKQEILDALERARLADEGTPMSDWESLRVYLAGLPGDWIAVVRGAGLDMGGEQIRYVSLDDFAVSTGVRHAVAH